MKGERLAARTESKQLPRRAAITSLILLALQTLTLQVLALVTLRPTEFGLFSIQYLIFALASSFLLSFVSDAWVRTARLRGRTSSWSDFSSTATQLSIVFGLIAAVAGVVGGMAPTPAILGSIAVGGASFRGCVRYHHVYSGDTKRVLLPEVAGLATLLGSLTTVILLSTLTLGTVTLVWASSAAVSAIASGGKWFASPGALRSWYREHDEQIKPLLRDSLLMDLGALGTPFVLAPSMGLSAFGTYRAVSNVAAPVRLILNPLRPLLASGSVTKWMHRRATFLLAAAAALAGGAAFCCLKLIADQDTDLGTLTSLAPYAMPTALFVVFSVAGTYFYMLLRPRSKGRQILVGRIIQTLTAIGGPLCGFAFERLGGAIWGLTIATGISSLAWFVIASRAAKLPGPEAPGPDTQGKGETS